MERYSVIVYTKKKKIEFLTDNASSFEELKKNEALKGIRKTSIILLEVFDNGKNSPEKIEISLEK